MTNPKPYVNEHTNLQRIISELEEVVQRDSKRHMMDQHLDQQLLDLIEYEILPVLKEQLDYEPTDADLGYGSEPALTADEMRTAAFRQHQELRT
jgi:hypothetical protein